MPEKKPKTPRDTSLCPYRGELSPEDVAKGMECALDNAIRLAKDARILFDAGRYPSSCALAILSIEETGKLSILRRLALGGDNDTIRTMWRDYSSHTKKNYMWLFLGMVSSGARRLDDFKMLFSESNAKLINNIKQISFYSGCYGNKNWSSPKDVVDKNLSGILLETAELVSSTNKRYPSAREIQLWIDIMQPVLGADFESQGSALVKWYKSLIKEGLVEDGKFGMDEFVRNGVVMPSDNDIDK